MAKAAEGETVILLKSITPCSEHEKNAAGVFAREPMVLETGRSRTLGKIGRPELRVYIEGRFAGLRAAPH